MSSDNIEKLYKNFGILADAKDKIGEHEKEYLEILTAVKGSDKEKRLASQFIARFFKHFPELSAQAIEAQLDLCEDEDVSIRKQAIKDLPNLCKDMKEYTQKIADILAQLLQAEDPTELSVVHNSLMSIFKIDAKSALVGIFSQVLTGEDVVRERCLKFLSTKFKVLSSEIMTKEAEDYLIAECKKVLQDVTADEFRQIMEILGMTRLGKTSSGQQELVNLIAEQAELERESFNPTDADGENVERLLLCLRYALPYFSAQVDSSQFVSYVCEHVLPVLSEIPAGEDEGNDPQLEILKLLAELCSHCNTIENPESKVEKIFKRLVSNMPLPPDDAEGVNGTTEPPLEFSQVECLMYSFHRLARHCPEFLTSNPDQLKDFRFRLQYFARGIQGYIKKLREALQGKQGDELKTDENRIKVVALKTTSNINILIKDLFHSPPSYKSVISLSWKPTLPVSQKSNPSPGQKRHTPITFGDSQNSKHLKSEREIYQPPSGKYSNKVSSYTPRRGRGRGGPRGGFSSRGNRGWRRGYRD
ncbi:apoptosis inhibitor 5 isoform X1 [Ischnura elegans]|uniref:apoptosis inhibitor 5 isoform X1 n=1 Tax=Ischnura elegans TaxID=197161 RepID=UPI001ED89010|nr:apoptosis inhibitor 5 isoform X1 [Ischnura elegans]